MDILVNRNETKQEIDSINRELEELRDENKSISDDKGLRFELFELYFLLNEQASSQAFLLWYEKEFPYDISEPYHFLIWTLMLRRNNKKADYMLAKTMLSNIYIIPHIIDKQIDEQSIWYLADFERLNYANSFPSYIRESIMEEELDWIQKTYNSKGFSNTLDEYISIMKKVADSDNEKVQGDLIRKAYSLINKFQE